MIVNGIGSINSNTATCITPENNTTYTLTVTNSAGITAPSQLTIELIFPEIYSFTASLTQATTGEAVLLTAIYLDGQGSIDIGVVSLESDDSKTVIPNTTTTYELTVENSVGFKVRAAVTIEIVSIRVIQITKPTNDIKVQDDLYLTVKVITHDAIASVIAKVEDRTNRLSSFSWESSERKKFLFMAIYP